jgi:FAD/FMN-containing dehydrogenase
MAAGAASLARRAARRRPRGECPASYEHVEGWGMAVGAPARVWRPREQGELRAALAEAARDGRSLALRGSGCSYGDASCAAGGELADVLDLTRFDAIRAFDRQTGVADLEPGVTIEKLWKHALPLGFWPRVVSGTMFPTVAGAAAMNIHGKNNFAVGTIGDAIRAFEMLLPTGDLVRCSRAENAELFHAAIGGFGMLGVFTRIELETKRVHSGDLEVRAFAPRNLAEMMATIEERKSEADYLVGWIDCFARGAELGRGLIHEARYLEEGEDPHPELTLRVEHQELPGHILGFPKSQVWKILRLLCNDPGMRLVDAFKYWAGRLEAMREPARQSHAAFAFLLDYVPGWKYAYGLGGERGGLIQYQAFLPKETAHATYCAMLERCHAAGHVPYLGVFKRHRPDPFLLTHAVDGWSFAMDFHVKAPTRAGLWRHCAALTELVLAAGGRFYFAKDLVIGPRDARRMYAPEKLDRFLELKRRCDPECRLQTSLWRRLFAAPAGE